MYGVYREPTYPERRLAELAALRRPLTDDEQREVMLRARQARRNTARNRRYAEDEAYRAKIVSRQQSYRRSRRRG
jgi:hypothetical protein